MEKTSANDNTVYNITINDTKTSIIQLGDCGNTSALANQEFTWNVYNGIGQYNLMLSYFMVFLMPNSTDDFLEILDENNNTVLNVNGNNQSYFNQLNNTYAYITPKQFTVHLKFSNKTDPFYKGFGLYGIVWGNVQLVQDTGCAAPAQLDANIDYFWYTSEFYSLKGAFPLNPLSLASFGPDGNSGPNSTFTTGAFYDSMSCKWQLKMHPEDYDFTQVKITPVNQLSSDDYLLVETNTGNQILSSDHNYTNTYKSFYSNESLFNITFRASKWNTSANGLN
uniref:CUB domain-containing protein n=1 Tax=Acrobeloides nanus TaxID=290746 RepID=A0A914DD85_9BILA